MSNNEGNTFHLGITMVGAVSAGAYTALGANRNLVPLERNKFESGDYTITFALIDKKNRSFIETLPFFSLINFRLTFETLRNFGFNVKVKNIRRLD